MVAEAAVVEEATAAAEDVIFTRCDPDELEDVDVTIQYTDGELAIDIYLDGPAADLQQVVDDAALAARRAAERVIEAD